MNFIRSIFVSVKSNLFYTPEYQSKYFTLLSMIYSTMLIISVLMPYKIVSIFGFGMPGGIFIFPLTYLLGGAVAEKYGRNMAMKMVYSSILCLIMFNVLLALIVSMPSIPTAPNQDIFEKAFGHSLRLSIGCLCGLLCSDINNIYRITKLKILFDGKYFIQRCLWVTGISEAIFNVVTYGITYYNVIPLQDILKLTVNSWCLKMIYSVIMAIPVLMLIKFLNKNETSSPNDIKIEQNYFKYNPELLVAQILKSSKEKQYQSAEIRHYNSGLRDFDFH